MVIFFGHEFMGEVVETGHDVKNIRKGERVVIPFVIACGDCFSVGYSNIQRVKTLTTDTVRR